MVLSSVNFSPTRLDKIKNLSLEVRAGPVAQIEMPGPQAAPFMPMASVESARVAHSRLSPLVQHLACPLDESGGRGLRQGLQY